MQLETGKTYETVQGLSVKIVATDFKNLQGEVLSVGITEYSGYSVVLSFDSEGKTKAVAWLPGGFNAPKLKLADFDLKDLESFPVDTLLYVSSFPLGADPAYDGSLLRHFSHFSFDELGSKYAVCFSGEDNSETARGAGVAWPYWQVVE